MFTQEQLMKADKVSQMVYEWNNSVYKRVKEVITQWGKNTINYTNLYTRVHLTYTNDMVIEVIIPTEFGAGFTLYISETKGIGFSHGSIGTYNVKANPRQRDIMMLYGKLLEHHNKLENDIMKLHKQLVIEKLKVERQYDNFNSENPSLMKGYCESDIYI